MNEIQTNYAASVLTLADKLNRENDEWEWQMKIDKIEQMHDFLGERDNQENEEE